MRRIAGILAGGGVIAALLVPAMGSAADPATPPDKATGTSDPAKTDPAKGDRSKSTSAETPNQPPRALLYAPSPTRVGETVAFEAYASSDPDGKIVRYEWDFDGDGTYETDGKDSATVEHAYENPGSYAVGLRVTDDEGDTGDGNMSLEVQPAPEAAPPAQAPGEDAGSADGSDADAGSDTAGADDPSGDEGSLEPFPDVIGSDSDGGGDSEGAGANTDAQSDRDPSDGREDSAADADGDSASAGDDTATVTAAAATDESAATTTTPAEGDGSLTARAAATKSVTISDFKYGPASVTVNVGDTVRWTNAGPTPHTATSSSGGFDTGLLAKGGSGSKTFSSAGTFSYICTPHPYMRGTVRVVASSSGSSGSDGSSASGASSGASGSDDAASGSGSGSSSTDPGAAATDAAGGLPSTGTNTLLVAAIGLALVSAGLALRFVAGHLARRTA